MGEFEFNVEEAAKGFGTEAIVRSFERIKLESKKGKGNIDGRDTKLVILRMNLEFENIQVIGRGANRIFICTGKRGAALNKKELQHYSNCGKGQIKDEDLLEELVLMYLKYGNRYHKIITARRLAYECGAVTKELYEFSRLRGHEEKREFYKKFVESEKYESHEFDLVYDVASKEVGRITRNIESILKNLKERKIIIYNKLTHGIIEGKDYEEDKHEVLQLAAVLDIKNKQSSLREMHSVSMRETLFSYRNNRVKEYKKEEWEYLMLYGYKRIYTISHIELIDWNKEVDNPINEWNSLKSIFRRNFISHAFHNAEERNNAFFDKPARVREPLKILGGKNKPKGTWMATEYEKIFGSNTLQTHYIIQLKFSRIYSLEYERILTKLQNDIA